MDKLLLYDGTTKSIALEQYPESAWTYLSGKPNSAESSPQAYFKAVPWLFRGVGLRADAVAAMPFVIFKGKREFDTSTDYQNKVGFIPNPQQLLWLIEASLTLEPQTYLFRERAGQLTKRLRYITPFGAEPHIDAKLGLDYFVRFVNSAPVQFKPVDDIVYFFRRATYQEEGAGPGDESPGKAALMASGVLANVDEFVAAYFKRGAVKATLLSVKGNPPQAEREKLESWWNNLFSGVRNAWRQKVINADTVTATVIGEGLESLRNEGMTIERREDIATALGVPHSLLFSNASNFATAQEDDKHFYSKTIVPECEYIQAVLNEQVFEPLGLRFDFQPETLPAFQKNKGEQATALSQLVSAGLPLIMAMDILGFELTEEQRNELVEVEKEKEARAQEMQEQFEQGGDQPDEEREDQGNQRRREDMSRWQRKALKSLERGKGAAVSFESEAIPAEMAYAISIRLAAAETPEQVKAAFVPEVIPHSDTTGSTIPVDGLALLAAELKEARLLLEKSFEPSATTPA